MEINFNPNRIVILDEIRDLIIPLSEEEFFQLEKNIIKDGCLDPLIVWDKSPNEQILIDGHNRYAICTKNNIPFNVVFKRFHNMDDVTLWMLEHQMGRRNLTTDQMSYFRGYKYHTLKSAKGGYKQVSKSGRDTSKFLAEHFKVSRSTIKRDASYAEGINIIAEFLPKLKNEILVGNTSIRRADIIALPLVQNRNEINIQKPEDIQQIARSVKALKKETKEPDDNEEQNNTTIVLQNQLKEYQNTILKNLEKIVLKKDNNALQELSKLYKDLFDYVNS